MRCWPYLGILSFLMGCASIPPQIVENQIEHATAQIHTVQLRSEPLNQAETYLNQAILAQTEKRWEQAYQLGEWAELRSRVAAAAAEAKQATSLANEIDYQLQEQRQVVESARLLYEKAKSELHLLKQERQQ